MGIPIIYFIMKSGNSRFWKLVRKYPLKAYKFFKENDCWYVIHPDENSNKPAEGNWTGPFFTNIPNIGRIKIYGKAGQFETKQEEFIKRFEN